MIVPWAGFILRQLFLLFFLTLGVLLFDKLVTEWRIYFQYLLASQPSVRLSLTISVFEYVPMEPEMRAVHRIFYFHVPSAWLCFIGFLGVLAPPLVT